MVVIAEDIKNLIFKEEAIFSTYKQTFSHGYNRFLRKKKSALVLKKDLVETGKFSKRRIFGN